MPQPWRFLQSKALSRKGLIILLKSKCALSWKKGSRRGRRRCEFVRQGRLDAYILIAVIQKGGSVLCHERHCRSREQQPHPNLTLIQCRRKSRAATGITVSLPQCSPLITLGPCRMQSILRWRCLLLILTGREAPRMHCSLSPCLLTHLLLVSLQVHLRSSGTFLPSHQCCCGFFISAWARLEPSFGIILNRCFLNIGISQYRNATTDGFKLRFELRNFSVPSRIGAVTLKSSHPIRHNSM